jgi:molecular chaperone GrpE
MKIKSDKGKEKSSEADILRNQLVRALADYDNLRKRVEREKEEVGRVVSLGLILRLLAVLDILESAQNHLKDQGLAIAITEFKKVLAEEGLEEIRPKPGDKFDPNVHEAIESVDGKDMGKIAELILPGWKFRDGKVVRVAKVKVFGEKSEKKEELEKELERKDYM